MPLFRKDSHPYIVTKRRFKVIFMGKYQLGKSLIINALLNNYSCEIGSGLETTKRISKVGTFGNFDIYDSPGVGGDLLSYEDAIVEARSFDFVIFICKDKQLDKFELKFLRDLTNEEILHSIIFNVNCDKYDEDDQRETEEIISAIISQKAEIGDSTIPVFDREILCVKPHFLPNIGKLSNGKIFTPVEESERVSIEKSGIVQLRNFLGKPKGASLDLSDYLSIYIEIRKYANGNMG